MRVLSVPVTRSGEVIGVVQVAQSHEFVEETVDNFVVRLVPLGLLAIGLAAIGGLFVSGRAMRPVRGAFERQQAFVADASHELKTPLTLIRVDAEVMGRRPRDREDQEILQHLLGETTRMDAILPTFYCSRLDAGETPTVRETFNLTSSHRGGRPLRDRGGRRGYRLGRRRRGKAQRHRRQRIYATDTGRAARQRLEIHPRGAASP